ncbi:PREDICTED: E3 ubiquitin-ligase [Prunus dulcis]|uniref:RING-type E3 ubiquitin transferase n=2 Tax=Prunus dulcis TaxID=3755 RepID=A0A5E4ENB6_PRUDU|nr:E3 ubiquitin-protein ligase RHF2A-like isoform X1 [Prunus dulcis]XP_034225375.1 E3 ubiquitin-protein ligase RHF2A-like isoform X2 [Prunus dulcis]VVA15338.1 PREDICTED: E3 ubiquitin-ligase [Prunus dulcis]
MEVPDMEAKKSESHMISAAAFVEGGIQEACAEACSICLEEFCESDPSVVTTCKHEFHLHCILEWCQRSSQCPMCWQAISLKDSCSQELLEAVERERSFRNTSRNATIFHHPTLGDFEFQHLPGGTNNAELEERIIQHLAAAASMGRAHHNGRREGQRSRSSARGHPHFSVFSTHPSASPLGPVSAPGGDSEPAEITVASPSTPLTSDGDESSRRSAHFPSVQTDGISPSASGSVRMHRNRQGLSSSHWNSTSQSSPLNQDRAGPSDLQSISESLKSKFNSMSMRYKESFSRSTRGWKERLFSRSTSMSELSSEVRREVNAGIATVSRMMERLETKDIGRAPEASVANHTADGSAADQSNNPNSLEIHGENRLSDNNRPGTTCPAGSASN